MQFYITNNLPVSDQTYNNFSILIRPIHEKLLNFILAVNLLEHSSFVWVWVFGTSRKKKKKTPGTKYMTLFVWVLR